MKNLGLLQVLHRNFWFYLDRCICMAFLLFLLGSIESIGSKCIVSCFHSLFSRCRPVPQNFSYLKDLPTWTSLFPSKPKSVCTFFSPRLSWNRLSWCFSEGCYGGPPVKLSDQGLILFPWIIINLVRVWRAFIFNGWPIEV